MHLPTYVIAGVGTLTLIVGTIWLLTSRKNRHRLSKEEEETMEGLKKVSKRTGTRWGAAASVDEDLNSHHDSSGGSDGSTGGSD